MGFGDHSFSFFPFGALYCLTLFCFVAIAIFNIRYRSRGYNQGDQDIILILKRKLVMGDIDEAKYQRLKELLTK